MDQTRYLQMVRTNHFERVYGRLKERMLALKKEEFFDRRGRLL